MTKKQQSRLNMFKAVLQFLLNNTTVTATIAAFTPIFTAFQNKLGELDTAIAGEAAIITGTTTDKKSLKLTLCQTLRRLGEALTSYAATIDNNAIKEAVSIPLSKLKRLKDETLVAQAQNYHDLANNNIASLGPWNVTAADITALQSMIDAYITAVPSPRNKRAQRTAFNKAQALAGKETTAILKDQMDPLIYQFSSSNTEFYNQYVQNRIIVDAATTATKIRGTILSGIDDKPLQGVTVTVDGTELSAISDKNGKFTIKNLTPGLYQVNFIKAGFIDKTIEDIEVKLGKPSNINTTLSQAA